MDMGYAIGLLAGAIIVLAINYAIIRSAVKAAVKEALKESLNDRYLRGSTNYPNIPPGDILSGGSYDRP